LYAGFEDVKTCKEFVRAQLDPKRWHQEGLLPERLPHNRNSCRDIGEGMTNVTRLHAQVQTNIMVK